MIEKTDENGKSDGYEIVPHCKTPAGDRRLLLNQTAKDTLELIKEINQKNGFDTDNDALIFQRVYKGEITSCTPRCFDDRIRTYCEKADMVVIKSCHDIRRTVITKLYANGMPLKNLQRFAGHASLQQTMDYIRFTEEDVNQGQYIETLSDTSIGENVVLFKRA